MKTFALAALAATTALVSVPAAAGTIVLTNGGSNNQHSKTFSNSEISVKATAFSIDTSNTIRSADLASWATHGLGVENDANDNSHTIDNSGWTDFIVFQFDKAVSLTGAMFYTGWHGMNDTDATIGSLDFDFGQYGLPWSYDLTSSLVGGSQNALTSTFATFSSNSNGNGNQSRSFNAGLASGNVWMISPSLINSDGKADGFKLANLTYRVTPQVAPVPEPATWAMLILGMGAVGGAMRRRTSTVRSTRSAIRFA